METRKILGLVGPLGNQHSSNFSSLDFLNCTILIQGASLVAHMVKNPSTMQETRVRSLGGEDSLEKGMTAHSSILAWGIPWTEEPGGLQSMRSQGVRYN